MATTPAIRLTAGDTIISDPYSRRNGQGTMDWTVQTADLVIEGDIGYVKVTALAGEYEVPRSTVYDPAEPITIRKATA